jgi:hypothetical protein
MQTTADDALKSLSRLVGTWTTEASHPALPGVIVHGRVASEWLEGERFLIQRARTDHADFPDSIAIIGFTDRDRIEGKPGSTALPTAEQQLTMHYFDSRGVFRVYEARIDGDALRYQRTAPGFSQRFEGTFGSGGGAITGLWQVCEDDVHWADDLQITYRRDPVAPGSAARKP